MLTQATTRTTAVVEDLCTPKPKWQTLPSTSRDSRHHGCSTVISVDLRVGDNLWLFGSGPDYFNPINLAGISQAKVQQGLLCVR